MENVYEKSQGNFINKTLLTMASGLFITFIISILTPMFITQKITYRLMAPSIIIELILVFFLSSRINKISVNSARNSFYLYAIFNGFTMSIIFINYNIKLASMAFLVTSVMFLCSGIIGLITKENLTVVGRFVEMMLIGLFMLILIQLKFGLYGLNYVISLFGILILCGFTAYKIQKIKRFHAECFYLNSSDVSKFVIVSALHLYLDFVVSLFLYFFILFADD